jgi:hypothetical protein
MKLGLISFHGTRPSFHKDVSLELKKNKDVSLLETVKWKWPLRLGLGIPNNIH